MDPQSIFGGNEALDNSKEGFSGHTKARDQWRQMGDAEKAAKIQAEMNRIKQLPAVSTYATHRIRVLNKVLQLLTIKPQVRTPSESEELELLFAGLSI